MNLFKEMLNSDLSHFSPAFVILSTNTVTYQLRGHMQTPSPFRGLVPSPVKMEQQGLPPRIVVRTRMRSCLMELLCKLFLSPTYQQHHQHHGGLALPRRGAPGLGEGPEDRGAPSPTLESGPLSN